MVSRFYVTMFLETLFKRKIDNISKEDLLKVTSIPVQFIENDSDEEKISFFDIISMFPNLQKVVIKGMNVNNDIINDLSKIKLEVLVLDTCSISSDLSLEKLIDLVEISIFNCVALNFSFLNTLSKEIKKISIINPTDEKTINLFYIKDYKELKSLILEKCVVNNIDYLSKLIKLEVLSLLWSDVNEIDDSDVFSKISSLKELYISECYCDAKMLKGIPSLTKVYYNLNHLTLV